MYWSHWSQRTRKNITTLRWSGGNFLQPPHSTELLTPVVVNIKILVKSRSLETNQIKIFYTDTAEGTFITSFILYIIHVYNYTECPWFYSGTWERLKIMQGRAPEVFLHHAETDEEIAVRPLQFTFFVLYLKFLILFFRFEILFSWAFNPLDTQWTFQFFYQINTEYCLLKL